MALLHPSSSSTSSYDYYLPIASTFDFPTTFSIPQLEDEEDLLLFHLDDFNNFLPPPPQPPLFFHPHHPTSITTPPPPDSYYYDDMIHFHHDPHDPHCIQSTIPSTPVDSSSSSYDYFHFPDSDFYSHHHPHPAHTHLIGFEEHSTFFPPDLPPLYLPPPQLHHDHLLFDEPPPKRHKSSHYPASNNNCTIPPPPPPPFHDHFSPNYANTLAPSSHFHTFNTGYYNNNNNNKEKGGQRRRPTAQSIAARERRKRISDKTQELARLLPGASSKTNTAEMLQNAFTYVNFLQAQLHLLRLVMDSSSHHQNLQVLSSSAVQEKLYTNHKCLVPLDFLTHLAQDLPHNLAKELNQFITTL